MMVSVSGGYGSKGIVWATTQGLTMGTQYGAMYKWHKEFHEIIMRKTQGIEAGTMCLYGIIRKRGQKVKVGIVCMYGQ